MQKSIGYGARAERKRGEREEKGDRRGVGTQNWPLMESKHLHFTSFT